MREFIINHKKKLILWSSISAAAALLSAFAIWALFIPYMYVSVDVNPSIEYAVNHMNRVISAKAVNSDGSEILSGLSLKNKTIDEAVKETVQKISDKGYFDASDPGAIEITTSNTASSTDKADSLASDLQKDAQQVTEDQGKAVDVEADSVTPEFVQQAKDLGISPGKLNLIKKLQASSDDPSTITVDDWKDKPVKDIMKTIKENRKADKATKNGDDGSTSASTATTETIDSSDSMTAADNKSSETVSADSQTNATENFNPNSNATKNCPNSNANSNATNNWKYSNTTVAQDTGSNTDVNTAVQTESNESHMQTSHSQTTHTQTTHTKR